VIKQAKDKTSHYINKQKLTIENFYWQRGFTAFTVSEKGVKKVYQYIKIQKMRHLQTRIEKELISLKIV